MAVETFAGFEYDIPAPDKKLPHTYAWSQKTCALVTQNYFCGGEGDQWVFETLHLQSFRFSGWLSITDYLWTPYIIGRESEYPARVWESVYAHECTKEDWIPMPAQQLSVIQQVWAEVDAAYYKFNNDNTMTAEDTTKLAGYMRGLCTAIRILMNPRFPSDDSVVAEVHKRHVMRTADEPYQTPGVGDPLDPQRLMEKTNGFTRTNTKPVAEPTLPTHNLTAEQVQSIQGAKGAGFPAADLAKMYGVTVRVIESL